MDAEAAEGAAPSDEAPADADEDQAPAESAANYDSSWSGPSALPRSGSKSAPSSSGSGWALVMGALVLIAIFAAARPGHHMTTRASAKALTPLPQRTLAPVGVRITSPVDGNTVHAHSVVIKGVVARGDARVMVNGDSAVLVGHRFAMRVPLHVGYNEFDVSAEEPGFGAGLTSVSIVRTRSTSERAALRARRVARRVAAPRRQASIPAGQRAGAQGPAQTTYTGVSGSTNGNTVDVAATDADLVQRPPSSKAPSASTPTPTPTPSPSTPAPLPADPTPTP